MIPRHKFLAILADTCAGMPADTVLPQQARHVKNATASCWQEESEDRVTGQICSSGIYRSIAMGDETDKTKFKATQEVNLQPPNSAP